MERKQPQTLPMLYRLGIIESEEPEESPDHEADPGDPAEDAAEGEIEETPEDRTVTFSCSSEAPAMRWFGEEILDHSPESVDLSRFNRKANALWNHQADCPIGVIEKTWLQNRRIYVSVRFSRNEKGQEILNDIRDGILNNVSIGYVCHEMKLESSRDDGNDTYRITRWEPMEVSIVSVPADYSVGIGRSAENREYPVTITNRNATDNVENIPVMEIETVTKEEIAEMIRSAMEGVAQPEPTNPKAAEPSEVETRLLTQERERCANINALGKHMGNMELAADLIASGASLEEANRRFFALQQASAEPQKPVAMPMVNTHLEANRDSISGILRDYQDVIENSLSATWVSKITGFAVKQRYNGDSDRFLRDNRDLIRREMERHAKSHGLLRGNHGVITRAATQQADVPPLFLSYLSGVIRLTHTEQFVWHQFTKDELELGQGPGKTIEVSRDRYIPKPSSVSDRVLDPAIPLTASRQNLASNSVVITLEECGLGKSGVTGAEPIGIPQFLSAYSLRSLENIATNVLGHDYQRWVDFSIRTQYSATTRIVYNKRGNIALIPGGVGTGDDGTLTETFLNSLYGYMTGTLQIPVDGRNCLYLVLNPMALIALKNSFAARQRYMDRLSLEELTNLMSAVNNIEMPTISGYVGTFCNFHIFQSNAAGVGNAGSEGVQTETLGVGATLTRSSYAFGTNAVARAKGMDVEIVSGEVTDFKRTNSYIWYSHEKTAALDVDPAINSEQQLRVVVIRTVDIPV